MNQVRWLLVAALFSAASVLLSPDAAAQSVDWQEVVWREPQVRYLLADMTLGGHTKLKDVAVVGVTHDKWGEAVLAAVVLHE